MVEITEQARLIASEARVDMTAHAICGDAHRHIWMESDFTPAEARLCWLTVIQKASSEESVGYRYAPMAAGGSARAATEPSIY